MNSITEELKQFKEIKKAQKTMNNEILLRANAMRIRMWFSCLLSEESLPTSERSSHKSWLEQNLYEQIVMMAGKK